MPTKARALQERGILRPREMEIIHRVFVAACQRRGFGADSEEGKELALNLVALYEAGMIDEDELLTAVGFSIGRKG